MIRDMLLPKHFVFHDFLPVEELDQLQNYVLERPEGFRQATAYVEGAQQEIVNVARRLEAEGKIIIARGGTEDAMV